MRTRNLSQQGRELFSSAMTMTSSGNYISMQISPRTARKTLPSLNTFAALRESDDEDNMEMEEDSETSSQSSTPSPMTRQLSARSSSLGLSPRWETVTTRRPPKMQLEGEEPKQYNVATPTYVPEPVPIYASGAGADYDEENGDLSQIWGLTTDTKGRRETRKSVHGSKSNTFKAMKQRLYSMAKRDEQREADRRRRGLYDEPDEYEEEDFE